MKRSLSLKINLVLLVSALVFGQVGAGFFHNKHDAHEAVIDLDKTMLVEHGEHCKICSVDWLHQFLVPDPGFPSVEEEPTSVEISLSCLPVDSSPSLTRDRSPPTFA